MIIIIKTNDDSTRFKWNINYRVYNSDFQFKCARAPEDELQNGAFYYFVFFFLLVRINQIVVNIDLKLCGYYTGKRPLHPVKK